MDTGKPLLHDFIFKVQNPHLWKMSKENVLFDFKFYFYQHTVLLCEIRCCVSLNKQEAKSTLWSKSFQKWMDSKNERMLLFGAVTALKVSKNHPGDRRGTCHQQPFRAGCDLLSPWGTKEGLHHHLPASPAQQQFPQQNLSTTRSCALGESKPKWPCGTTAQSKPSTRGNQPATSQSPGGLQGCF